MCEARRLYSCILLYVMQFAESSINSSDIPLIFPTHVHYLPLGHVTIPWAELPISTAPASQREEVWCNLPNREALGVGSMTAELGLIPSSWCQQVRSWETRASLYEYTQAAGC